MPEPVITLTLRERLIVAWTVAWSDPKRRKWLIRMAVLAIGSGLSWVLNTCVCDNVPPEYEATCHASSRVLSAVTRMFSVGGG